MLNICMFIIFSEGLLTSNINLNIISNVHPDFNFPKCFKYILVTLA